jgi:hypothetical protein
MAYTVDYFSVKILVLPTYTFGGIFPKKYSLIGQQIGFKPKR